MKKKKRQQRRPRKKTEAKNKTNKEMCSLCPLRKVYADETENDLQYSEIVNFVFLSSFLFHLLLFSVC